VLLESQACFGSYSIWFWNLNVPYLNEFMIKSLVKRSVFFLPYTFGGNKSSRKKADKAERPGRPDFE